MQGSEDRWRPGRIAGFLALGLLIYAALFLWSDGVQQAHAGRNPFARIAAASPRSDWVVLGASHALPLGFAGVPALLRDATGQEVLTLAVAGGGPGVSRMVAERYFSDHGAGGVLIVLDSFAFLDPRWNAARIGDADILPRIPADRQTLAVLWRAVGRGLPAGTFLAHATGFARINDRGRFTPDQWEAEVRFDSAPRPSDAADAARIAYLYPGPSSEPAVDRALADLQAVITLARGHGAPVVLVLPPLPERFRARLPPTPALSARIAAMAGRLGVPLIDHETLLPAPRFYFDTDHLNRSGVEAWIAGGLGDVLRGQE